jgi:hypothetical protein
MIRRSGQRGPLAAAGLDDVSGRVTQDNVMDVGEVEQGVGGVGELEGGAAGVEAVGGAQVLDARVPIVEVRARVPAVGAGVSATVARLVVIQEEVLRKRAGLDVNGGLHVARGWARPHLARDVPHRLVASELRLARGPGTAVLAGLLTLFFRLVRPTSAQIARVLAAVPTTMKRTWSWVFFSPPYLLIWLCCSSRRASSVSGPQSSAGSQAMRVSVDL